ncbi:MAG TPA: SusD/RagB family nutrient-binding outer membrane lipoprotein, partial [Ferruginibacter sp.]|nr:SusD/RagB family nutrient-binding outer membrane lipoprotein [Ferruginibacter sp.]
MKRTFGSIVILATLFLAACSNGYYDVNTNPNQSTNASVDLVLSNALKTTAAQQVTGYSVLSEWMNYWSPSGSYAISSSDGSSYKETTDFADNNGMWTNLYNNLEDYQYIETTATANNQYFYTGAAKVMKAYVYQQLVDMFNNVPYTQALQGAANLTPKYDNGKDIYEALSTDLGNAVTLFQRSDAVGSATQDVLFGGNNSNWAKFANTLRLRILMRQTEIPGRAAYIQAEINKIIANGAGFLTTDAAVNPGYTNSTGKQNPFWAFSINTAGTYTQDFWRAAQYTITFSQAHNDPRYTRWYAPTNTGAYVGTTLGASGNPVGSASSTFGPGVLKSVSQSAVIMSAAESYFLQAEAILRGFLPGSDLTMFNNGVQASFT